MFVTPSHGIGKIRLFTTGFKCRPKSLWVVTEARVQRIKKLSPALLDHIFHFGSEFSEFSP